jgi:hypothetical protein
LARWINLTVAIYWLREIDKILDWEDPVPNTNPIKNITQWICGELFSFCRTVINGPKMEGFTGPSCGGASSGVCLLNPYNKCSFYYIVQCKAMQRKIKYFNFLYLFWSIFLLWIMFFFFYKLRASRH